MASFAHLNEHFKVEIDNLAYVGKAVGYTESSGGVVLSLQFSDGDKHVFKRETCTITSDELTHSPHRIPEIGRALEDNGQLQTPDWPGISKTTRSRPYLNQS